MFRYEPDHSSPNRCRPKPRPGSLVSSPARSPPPLLPHRLCRREAICGTYNNHDAQTYCDRKVTMQTDVTSLGVMLSDVLVGRPANIGELVGEWM